MFVSAVGANCQAFRRFKKRLGLATKYVMLTQNDIVVITDEIKIVLVDNHPLTRLGVRMSFENFGPSCKVVAEADTVFGAKQQLEQHPDSDLLLLDILLPDNSGIELVQHVKESYPDMKVLVLSSETAEHTLFRLPNLGVKGFVNKTIRASELVTAIHEIMKGYSYFSQDLAPIIEEVKTDADRLCGSLTSRELEIVRLCASGFYVQQIANKLEISPRTVEVHKNRIFRKLGFNSTSELIYFAYQNGIVKVKKKESGLT